VEPDLPTEAALVFMFVGGTPVIETSAVGGM
jgi:hypothetical protein